MADFHAHAVLWPTEQARDFSPDERRRLRRRVNRHAAIARLCDGYGRLERQMEHLLHGEGVLEHTVGRCERCFDVAPAQRELERNVGVAPALQMLEIREEAGWFQFI